MAKAVYCGVGGVARKVKKIYVGVDDIARKVKKGYCGVGGVARLFYSAGEVGYYGTTTSTLGYAVIKHAGASNPKYALFAGGCKSNTVNVRSAVYAYNSSLTRSSPSSGLSSIRHSQTGGSIGNYALFVCGTNGTSYYRDVHAYDTSLTEANVTSLFGSDGSSGWKSATNGSHVVFAGGDTEDGMLQDVYCYDASLTQSILSMNEPKASVAVGSINGYFLLAGGDVDGGSTNEIEVFDASLTKQSSLEMPNGGRDGMMTGNVGSHVLFAGGQQPTEDAWMKDVYAVSGALTLTITTTNMSAIRRYGAAVSINDYALFTGGSSSTVAYTKNLATVDIYNSSLTRTAGTNMSDARQYHATATVGDYALISGGNNTSRSTSPTKTVDVYVVS